MSRTILYCAVAASCCLSATLRADITDFRVNNDGPGMEQSHPRIAVAGDGSFVVIWSDLREGESNIFLQSYKSDGSSVGRNRKINDDSLGAYQAQPAIAVDVTGLYSSVWLDYRSGQYPFSPDLFFQRLDSALMPFGNNIELTSEPPDTFREDPDIDLSTFGDGVVVWADYRNGDWDIYGQRIASDGALIGTNFLVNDDNGTAQQHAPRVSVAPEGWFVVTWYDNRAGNDDVFFQRYSSGGIPTGVNIKVNSNPGVTRQAFSDVAADGSGNFTVVWVDWRNGTYPQNPDIYARKYDTSLVAIADETKVNSDGTARAQREPTISADRMGNVAIIWSDSTSGSWDINGQMIDVNGVVREANFRANQLGDSSQLQADVALDGRFRYVVWTDKRNGDWDIFCSVAQYNDPTISPIPSSLQFSMSSAGALPAAQFIRVEHTGYNPLNYTATPSVSWLDVVTARGLTPDSLRVQVNDPTLTAGTHSASIILKDSDNNGPDVAISVRLEVTVPILDVSTDSISFSLPALRADSGRLTFDIINSGTGVITWSASETAEWLTLSDSTGSTPTTVTATTYPMNLPIGLYSEPIVISSPFATGSPDTLWAVLDLFDPSPVLMPSPDSFNVQTVSPESLTRYLRVDNGGYDPLSWNASSTASWLQLSRLSGSDGDTVALTIDTAGMLFGSYFAEIILSDSMAVDTVDTIPFAMVYSAEADTVMIADLRLSTGGVGAIPIEIIILDSTREIILPLSYDTSRCVIDSVLFSGSLPVSALSMFSTDLSGNQTITIFDSSTTGLLPNRYFLGDLFLTAGQTIGSTIVTFVNYPFLPVEVVRGSGIRVSPVVNPGILTIDASTGIDDILIKTLPQRMSLSQNFPNPFNPNTEIEFFLPRATQVELQVYNILGQSVSNVANGRFPAGNSLVSWDGRDDYGRPVASGIYFYRLKAGETSLVRKMALVK